MAKITRGNWRFTDPGDDIPDGSVIAGGNFSQHTPDTPIMVGKTLTIQGGNFVNVRKDPHWTIEGANWTQKNRCSHRHPTWVQHGLAECAENCSHVIDIDTVTIDGVLVDRVYHYKDTQVG
jgi:hypothetical protein